MGVSGMLICGDLSEKMVDDGQWLIEPMSNAAGHLQNTLELFFIGRYLLSDHPTGNVLGNPFDMMRFVSLFDQQRLALDLMFNTVLADNGQNNLFRTEF